MIQKKRMGDEIRVLIVGGGSGGKTMLELFAESEDMQVMGLVDIKGDAPGIERAEALGVPTSNSWKGFLVEGMVDVVVDVTGVSSVHEALQKEAPKTCDLIAGDMARIFWMLVDKYEHQVVECSMDITDRKRAEESLRESEENHRLLVQNLHAGVVVHAPDTHIILANEQASVLLGLTVDQMMGKASVDPAWRFVHEDGSTLPLEEYPVNQVISRQTPIRDMVVGVNRPVTNDIVWLLVHAFPEMEADGTLCQIVVTFVDITDRKHAEDELKTKMDEVEKFNKLMVGREGRIVEVKSEINALLEEMGREPKYVV